MAVEGLCPEQFKAQTRAAMRTVCRDLPRAFRTSLLQPPVPGTPRRAFPWAFRKIPSRCQ